MTKRIFIPLTWKEWCLYAPFLSYVKTWYVSPTTGMIGLQKRRRAKRIGTFVAFAPWEDVWLAASKTSTNVDDFIARITTFWSRIGRDDVATELANAIRNAANETANDVAANAGVALSNNVARNATLRDVALLNATLCNAALLGVVRRYSRTSVLL